LISLLVFAALAATWFWRNHDKFALMHALPDTGCACGDFHEEVSGINILNPLRDRGPETEAEQFFRVSVGGHCSVRYNAGLCEYFEKEAPVKGWKLVNAEPRDDGIDLFYKLDSSKRGRISNERWTGEGCVHVKRESEGWRVAWYSAYF
jgi:hypothetical protein